MQKGKVESEEKMRFLSQSILLEEGEIPHAYQRTVVWSSALIALFLIWAWAMPVDVVAIAEGEVVPTTRVQKVQHSVGGKVREILVRDGDQVVAGQVLVRLDASELVSKLDQDRSRLSALEQRKNYLTKEILLRRNRGEGAEGRADVLELRKQESALDGDIAELSEIVRALSLRVEAAEVKAPADGVIHSLGVHSHGEVIRAGDTLLEVVPTDGKIVAEARVHSRDVGHVRKGQSVRIRFTTYDFARYGALRGTLENLSATSYLDEKGVPYFRATISLATNYMESGGTRLGISPGMTFNAEIRTGERTIGEYLLKPLFASAQSAFRER